MAKTIHIGICDDEQATREHLADMIREICPQHAQPVIDMFPHGRALMNAFNSDNPFDCVFLDILMDDVDGIQIARMLRETGYANLIIFVSNTSLYALKGYEVSAYGYYLKPITKETLAAILDVVMEKYSRSRLLVSTRTCLHSVVTDTIRYIESVGRMASIVTEAETLQVYITVPMRGAARLTLFCALPQGLHRQPSEDRTALRTEHPAEQRRGNSAGQKL